MKQYKIVDVDYTNCHPVIAEALKQGKRDVVFSFDDFLPEVKLESFTIHKK